MSTILLRVSRIIKMKSMEMANYRFSKILKRVLFLPQPSQVIRNRWKFSHVSQWKDSKRHQRSQTRRKTSHIQRKRGRESAQREIWLTRWRRRLSWKMVRAEVMRGWSLGNRQITEKGGDKLQVARPSKHF